MIFKLFTKFGEFVIFSARSFQIEFLDCKLEGKYLKLPKMTAVRMKLHRPISEKWKLKSVTVSREPSGKYFAVLNVEFEPEPRPNQGGTIGIDVGIKTCAVNLVYFDLNIIFWKL